MQSSATTPAAYLESLPGDRKKIIADLRKAIIKNIPKGYKEVMSYGMLGYVVPHSIYPSGYHCDTSQPLPFICLASQKNHIALYHMGIYAMPGLLDWFQKQWKNHSQKKLDIGKSCIRFKKPEDIPVSLIGDLVSKVTTEEWIACYEKNFKKKA